MWEECLVCVWSNTRRKIFKLWIKCCLKEVNSCNSYFPKGNNWQTDILFFFLLSVWENATPKFSFTIIQVPSDFMCHPFDKPYQRNQNNCTIYLCLFEQFTVIESGNYILFRHIRYSITAAFSLSFSLSFFFSPLALSNRQKWQSTAD